MGKKKKKRSRGRQPSRADKEVVKATTFAAVAQGLYWTVKIIRELLELRK